MKKIILIFLLMPIMTWANMISLNQYMSQNPNIKENEMFYITTRCSAIYYLGVELNKNKPDIQNRLQSSANTTLEAAILSRKLIFPNDPIDIHMNKALETTGLMLDKYVQVSNENYISTGSYFTESMWSDMEVCRVVVESY